MKIAIFGFGFVGQAVALSYLDRSQVLVYDPSPEARARAEALGFRTFEDHCDLGMCEAVFVCVPTPARADGSCDDQYLRAAVGAALYVAPTIICKSTAPVSVYEQFDPHLVAFVPEFLRAATADQDYLTQPRVVIGADSANLRERVSYVLGLSRLNGTPVTFVPRNAAIIGKYAHNCALAVKVAVMNEMYGLAQAQGVEWTDVTAVLVDTNAGTSHTKVPGPDGTRGFGGACFPKDLKAALHEIEQVENQTMNRLPAYVLAAATEWSQ